MRQVRQRSSSLLVMLLTVTVISTPGHSQKQIIEREETWIGVFHQSRFTARSGLWLDLHFRTTDHFIREKTMTVARAGYVYHLSDELRFIGGYAFANRYNQSPFGRIPEHRPWQQVQWIQQKKKKFNVLQAFRMEQRYRKNVPHNDYFFNWRFRYNLSVTVPLRKGSPSSGPFLMMSNEVMVNAGKRILYNYFDQNRLFGGLGYRFSTKLNLHAGYLYVFQQEAMSGQFAHTHAVRIFLNHHADVRGEDR